MSESGYDFVDLAGTSEISWEDATKNIIEVAARTLRDLRVAEISRLDVKIRDNQIVKYRVRLRLSFKYEQEE